MDSWGGEAGKSRKLKKEDQASNGCFGRIEKKYVDCQFMLPKKLPKVD